MHRSTGLVQLDEIYITHYHADHYLGLPGLLRTYQLQDRDRPLVIFGPPGLKDLFGSIRRIVGRPTYELELIELDEGEAVRRDGYEIRPFAVNHGVRAYGYALVENDRPGRFDPDAAARLGVEPGPDFGRLQRGEAVAGVRPEQVLGPERPGRKIVISGDTTPCEPVAIAAHQADVLVHEATFAEEERDRAAETAHTTATQAAALAARADVRLLALTHLSTRYFGGELRDEARAVFADTVVPRDFDTIEVPLPERGEPELVRWEDARAPA
jgi:ribonuclease Z